MHMSTHIDYPNADLDRTDELPVLDVAAYEASLAENARTLSRTDTWTVEALRDIDELAESTRKEPRASSRAAGESPVAQALTVNVERILKRIAVLEADITEAHEANVALQKRSKTVETERDQQTQRIRALENDNARLAEHRSLAEEMTRRLEQQLRDQTRRSEAELKELTEQRAQAIAALEKPLADEKAANSKLARQLAAKLHDCERLSSLVEQRDRILEDLTQARERLSQQLQREEATNADLASKVAVAEQRSAEDRSTLQQREAVIAELKEALTAVGLERNAAQAQVREMDKEREALLPAANELALRTAELERSRAEAAQLHRELADARAEMENRARLLDEAQDELAAQRAHFMSQSATMAELGRELQGRDEIAQGLTAQLQTARDEQAVMSGQLSKLRARVKSLSEQVFRRDHEIAELQADLAVHTEALDAIRRDVNRIGGQPDTESLEDVEHRLEPIDRAEEPILLNGRTFTVGRTEDNDICIPSHLVSRHHARLLVGPTGVIIEDSASTNGCFVNGEQVRQRLLHDGDVLELGDMRYRLCTRSAQDTKVRGTSVPRLTTLPAPGDRVLSVVPTPIDKDSGADSRSDIH
jgi:chromosome segregation ATPase